MQLRIRAKLIGILLIAAVLPLCLALIAIEVLGYRYYRRERGRLLQETASFLATTIDHSLSKEIDKLDDWVELSHLNGDVALASKAANLLSESDFQERIKQIEARWPGMDRNSPELAGVLTNRLAQELREFQSVNPLFAEIFLTDSRGQLIATTEKTSDYWQADESWWQRSSHVRSGRCYLEGVHYDESAKVYSVDVCIPIYPRADGMSQPVGVLKAVLNVSPVLTSVPGALTQDGPSREVITGTGDVMFELYSRIGRRVGRQVNAAALEDITGTGSGWSLNQLGSADLELVGHAMLNLGSPLVDAHVPNGVMPLFVIVHDDVATVMAPVRMQIIMLAVAGGSLILLFSWAGYYIATRKIIQPIETLRGAATSLAASAKLPELEDAAPATPVNASAQRMLAELERIDTGDEIEDLARDFNAMSRRVLTYHEQLEGEIAAKTASIQEDLQFAREFQEALMPRSYPQVACTHTAHPLRLNFHHVYKPTSSVGGDFFDVLKLSDTRAGIFIADVMGHGARSALVTAILRTLLQDFADQANDPAKFLALINRHFISITGQGNQFVFVSAFYLVLDTEKCVAT